MKIRAYWHPANNFGDKLTPIIIKYITGMEVSSEKDSPRLFCIGSILADAKPGDVVWGSGAITPDQIERIEKGIKFVMVRGQKTREILIKKGFDVPEFTADPAVLLKEIYKDLKIEKKRRIGYIPHYLNYNRVKEENPEDFVVNLTNPIEKVIEDIVSCERVYSESLHSLICAEVFGIPVLFKTFWDHKFDFKWKFEDYYSSTGRELPKSFEEWEELKIDFDRLKKSFPWDLLPYKEE